MNYVGINNVHEAWKAAAVFRFNGGTAVQSDETSVLSGGTAVPRAAQSGGTAVQSGGTAVQSGDDCNQEGSVQPGGRMAGARERSRAVHASHGRYGGTGSTGSTGYTEDMGVQGVLVVQDIRRI